MNNIMAAHVLALSRSFPLKFSVPVRLYGLQQKMTKQERHELAEYRRKLTELRKQFKNEWLEQERMKQQEFSAQAAEAAATERRLVEEALESNRKENERMRQWREEKMVKLSLLKEEKQQQGEENRLKKEAKVLQKKMVEFDEFKSASEEFITMDNLDAKMEEAVEKETNYNFALKLSGEKILKIQ